MRLERARSPRLMYQRALPGGGVVRITVTPARSLLGPRSYRGDVVVERRGGRERRVGHTAPSIARAWSVSVDELLDQLFPLAQSDVAIATACLAHCKAGAKSRLVPA